MASEAVSTDTSQIKEWRSIVTLIVFVVTNLIVLFPFHVPLYIPKFIWHGLWDSMSAMRIVGKRPRNHVNTDSNEEISKPSNFEIFRFPMDFSTAPIIADLFLLAILAIGRQEVHDGTVGADGISPIDIMVFFLTLAYIAISIDASGLIRWLAFKVLQKAGKNGHLLYFYLYAFFFALATFAGNDPIILSGTAFLAYMTRVSSNIEHPRAWIYAQFAVANIGSAIMVSSNPTNLVLAGAFGIKFIHYTANMIVPVVVTAVVVFPFLLYIVFPGEELIPRSIKLHELPSEIKNKKPVNPNIPNARGISEEEEDDDEQTGTLSLEEIMNPFLDKSGAIFGAVVIAATLITILAVNASREGGHGEFQVYWVSLPGAFITLCWDLGLGWMNRKETREIARKGREAIALAQAERSQRRDKLHREGSDEKTAQILERTESPDDLSIVKDGQESPLGNTSNAKGLGIKDTNVSKAAGNTPSTATTTSEKGFDEKDEISNDKQAPTTNPDGSRPASSEHDEERAGEINKTGDNAREPTTLASLVASEYRWLQETFPTVMAVLSHLPLQLVPFALAMFVLVQALVTKGWVPVFAYGWSHWVGKTGTIGAIGGMGFLAVILCNFAGTNIGTTILLCRVVQAWVAIDQQNGTVITQRTFWATVYSMAIGVNYGAFSTAFSASLAGMLWRDILYRKHIKVRSLDFARMNLPIIAVSMVVGCVVLIGEVYITRSTDAYVS